MTLLQRLGKHPSFVVRQEEPFNGGPPLELLRRQPMTPNELFYVRNHGPVPEVDAAAYRLTVEGLVAQPLELSLAELRERFPRRALEATLQCAGNRRTELAQVAPIPGELPWGAEAISSAAWAGPTLSDVLAVVGPLPAARHVAFEGLDPCAREGKTFGFGGSIPLEKAWGPEVLLAWEMNGGALPPVHGFPLRAVVPGYIAARSVKWLSRITVQEKPSENYFQAKAYRLFPPGMHQGNVVWEEGLMLGDQPVNCVLCHPNPDDTVTAGRVEVQGVALAGGGRSIARVDLSSDSGRNWVRAELGPDRGPWVWRFFSGAVGVGRGKREIVARALDSAAHTQPSDPAQVWNFKGYVNNAWARVRVLAM